MMSKFDPTDLLADIDNEDAVEAAALAERQRRRREALTPAAELAAEIAHTRTEFLAADAERLAELSTRLKEAKKNGAPKDKLDRLSFAKLTARKSPSSTSARGRGERSNASGSNTAAVTSASKDAAESTAVEQVGAPDVPKSLAS